MTKKKHNHEDFVDYGFRKATNGSDELLEYCKEITCLEFTHIRRYIRKFEMKNSSMVSSNALLIEVPRMNIALIYKGGNVSYTLGETQIIDKPGNKIVLPDILLYVKGIVQSIEQSFGYLSDTMFHLYVRAIMVHELIHYVHLGNYGGLEMTTQEVEDYATKHSMLYFLDKPNNEENEILKAMSLSLRYDYSSIFESDIYSKTDHQKANKEVVKLVKKYDKVVG